MSYEQNLDLLTLNLADLADMPERPVLPAGTHLILITGFESKSDTSDANNIKHLLTVKGKFQSTLEYTDPVAGPTQAVEEGAEVEFPYFLHSDYSQGSFKKVWLPFAAANGWGTISDLSDGVTNSVLQITTSRKAQKDDKTKFNHNIDAVSAG